MQLHVGHEVAFLFSVNVANDCKELTICCSDTDVLILAVATYQQLGLENATDVYIRLSNRPDSPLETDMEVIEAFVCIMYDRGTDTFAVNKTR